MQKDRSFTLIELLVVIAIIGLISSLVLVNIGLPTQKQKARIAKTLEFSQSVQSALGVEARGIWELDEGSGTIIIDRSGYGNNGTISGGASFATDTPQLIIGPGQGKYSLSFNGVNGVVFSNSAVLTPSAITVGFWWKRTGPSGGVSAQYHHVLNNLAGASGSNANAFYIFSAGDRAFFRLTVGGLVKDVIITGLDINGWNYIGGVWDGSNMYGFVNGVFTAPLSATGALTTGTTALRIGRQTDYIVNGLVDEISIYGQALTIGQIQKYYAEGLEKHQYAKR